MKNLYIVGTTVYDKRDITKHGIVIKVIVKLDNVLIDQMEGNGIHISACVYKPKGNNNNYGNADGSYLENVTVTFCLNGIFIEGCDANTIQIINSSTNENLRWGIFDNGFLGNSYIKPHAAFNGVVPLGTAKSVVSFAGKFYVAKPGFDGYFEDAPDSNFNKQPDINPAYWLEVTSINSTKWNNTTRYYSGGPICIRNQNAYTNIFNAYTEGFQPPIYLNTRSKVDGGHNAAGVYEGTYHEFYQNIEFIRNAGVVLPNSKKFQHHLSIGDETLDYSAALTVFNNADLPAGSMVAAMFKNNKESNFIGIKNAISTGYIGYNFDDFNFYTNGFGGHTAKLNSSGFFAATDNAQDLGTAAIKWKSIFANNGKFAETLSVGTLKQNSTCALIDLNSISKGLLLPRMTKAQRNSIVSPIAGLAIYQTDNTAGLRVFNGINWIKYNESVD